MQETDFSVLLYSYLEVGKATAVSEEKPDEDMI